MNPIEWIREGDELIGLIVRRDYRPAVTEFLTPPECTQQLGLIVHPKGGQVPPHTHLPVERRIVGTTEVLCLRSGAAELEVYSSARARLLTTELNEGDVVLLLKGGHALRMKADTVLLEVKQGPYVQAQDKEYFAASGHLA